MKKNIILFIFTFTIISGEVTNLTESQIYLNAFKAITVSPSTNYLDFGEEMVEAGKTIYPESPVVLEITGLYEKEIYVKVKKEVILTQRNGDTITFQSILHGAQGDTTEEGDFLVWQSSSSVFFNDSPVFVEFSGSIFLTNLESAGSYEGVVRIEVDYN